MNIMGRCYKKNPSVLSRNVGEKVILLPMQDNITALEKIYIVSGVGKRIWELIDEKNTVEKIKEMIIAEFKVNPKEAQSDLTSFIKKLKKRNYIITRENGDAEKKSKKRKKGIS